MLRYKTFFCADERNNSCNIQTKKGFIAIKHQKSFQIFIFCAFIAFLRCRLHTEHKNRNDITFKIDPIQRRIAG